MPDYYRLVNTKDPATDGTSEIVLAKGDDGRPTKVVSTGIPVQLNADDRKTVEKLGYSLESVSKTDAEKAEASGGAFIAASETTVAGPTPRKENDK